MDLRVKYTINVINDTFFHLLEQKPLEKITVSEICSIAEINRSTFYRYYKDVFEVMDKNIKQILCEITEKLKQNLHDTNKQFDIMFEILYQHKEFFLLLKRQNALKDVSTSIFQYFSTLSNNNFSDLHQYFTYYGFVGIFRYWINHDMKELPSEISKKAYELFCKIYG